MKLMADNYEDEHLKTGSDQTNHKPSPDQVTAGLNAPTGVSVSDAASLPRLRPLHISQWPSRADLGLLLLFVRSH